MSGKEFFLYLPDHSSLVKAFSPLRVAVWLVFKWLLYALVNGNSNELKKEWK